MLASPAAERLQAPLIPRPQRTVPLPTNYHCDLKEPTVVRMRTLGGGYPGYVVWMVRIPASWHGFDNA